MAATKENTQVAAQQEGGFNLVTMLSGMGEDERAEMMDELGDLGGGGIDYRAIKMPSGKVRSFTVEGDDPDDPDQMKELRAVVVFTHPVNARWADDFGGEKRAPACSAIDGRTGMDESGCARSCATCDFNKFKNDSLGMARKECKNMQRVYLLLDGRPHLYMLTVPPTSIASVRQQLRRVVGTSGGYTGAVLSFTLTAATSKGGNDYSKIAIRKVGALSPELAAAAREMRSQIKASYEDVAIEADAAEPAQPRASYGDAPARAAGGQQAAPATGRDGFMDIPEDAEAELPFM